MTEAERKLNEIKDELKKLFQEFDGDKKDEFIKTYPQIWDDVYDIMEDSRYHRAIINSALAGFDKGAEEMAKIKDAQIEKLVEALGPFYERIKDRNFTNEGSWEFQFSSEDWFNFKEALENFRKEVK